MYSDIFVKNKKKKEKKKLTEDFKVGVYRTSKKGERKFPKLKEKQEVKHEKYKRCDKNGKVLGETTAKKITAKKTTTKK